MIPSILDRIPYRGQFAPNFPQFGLKLVKYGPVCSSSTNELLIEDLIQEFLTLAHSDVVSDSLKVCVKRLQFLRVPLIDEVSDVHSALIAVKGIVGVLAALFLGCPSEVAFEVELREATHVTFKLLDDVAHVHCWVSSC